MSYRNLQNDVASASPHTREMSSELASTLGNMFAAGQLHLQRLTWESGADLLEKVRRNLPICGLCLQTHRSARSAQVGRGEAVHPMRT